MIVNANASSTSDPSANVLQLVGNAVEYLEKLHKQGQIAQDDKLKMFQDYINKQAEAESCRINAIRADDVRAVEIANERAIKQQETLAAQVAENAEVLRASTEKMATTIAEQLQQMTTQLMSRIEKLEQVQYENKGKQGASEQLIERVDEIEDVLSEYKGKNGMSIKIIFALVSLGSALAASIILVVIQSLSI